MAATTHRGVRLHASRMGRGQVFYQPATALQIQRTSKIPAGVPKEVKTGNKTGELDNVDNDAAIIWAPDCTYILCIMSSDAGGRIPEIVRLSGMVYDGLNE